MIRYLLLLTLSLTITGLTLAQTTKTALQYYDEGVKLIDQKKIAEAIQSFEKAIGLRADYSVAYKQLANLYYDEKNYEKALKNFERYIRYESSITSDEIYYRKGFSENELGKYNEAIASLNKANQIFADDASTYNELGYANYKLQNADNAILNYKKALNIKPGSVSGNNGMADVFRSLKKEPEEAIKYYKKTIESDAENKKAYYWTGWCYNDLSQYNDAVPFLKKAIEIDEKYVSAITELGYSHYALKNYDDALIQFKKSIGINKTELNLYYTGLCYVGKKQKAEVIKMVNELKELRSDYADKLQQYVDKL